jgi:multiple sugar transport system permease protein
MPIIAQVGRKSPKVRALVVLIYIILTLGSVTTVYPFLMMTGSTFTSLTDFREYRIIPRFFYDDCALAAKYLDDKYRTEQFDQFKLRYRTEEPVVEVIDGEKVTRRYGQFAQMEKMFTDPGIEKPEARRRVADWLEFTAALPMKYKDTFFHYRGILLGEVQTGLQKYLEARYGTIGNLNRAYGEALDDFLQIDGPYEAYDRHTWYPADDLRTRDWEEYRGTLPPRLFNVMTVRPLYQAYLQSSCGSIEALNSEWGTHYKYFWEVPFGPDRPEGPAGDRWETFVRKRMPLRFVRLDAAKARGAWTEHLRAKYGTADNYNALMEERAVSLESAPLPEHMPESSLAQRNWQEFYEQKAPLASIALDLPDSRYAVYLAGKYGDIGSLNEAYGTSHEAFEAVGPPYREADYYDMVSRRSEVIWGFATRNYAYVIKRVFLQGRALMNTFLLVACAVGAAVTVNPLAAYALSRYRLSYGAQVLIFMLATMAFPAEVAMIPNFLMIKELGLLNTFAALILPGLASGYSIFLLKGFFDSLPQELYEAATIDGAGEFTMFRVITMPLSLPILSVIALFSFSSAYASFIWAFTVCQDKRMWTLMVFLQQFQNEAANHPYLVMASLVLAAVPTVIVFLSAQKVLMRGIVVPTMK